MEELYIIGCNVIYTGQDKPSKAFFTGKKLVGDRTKAKTYKKKNLAEQIAYRYYGKLGFIEKMNIE